MSTKKCCRACLKEIRNRTTFTNILEPPSPPIYLRNGVEASSYLQCYYFCLHSNLSDYTNLSDYQYICGTCKLNLLKVAEFIVQSLRNEGFLMSMYDISKQDLISDIAENLLEETRSDDDEQSVANGYDYNEEPEILEDNLQNTTNICEVPNTTAEIEFLNAKYVEEDGGEKGEQYGEFESSKQNVNGNANIKYPETINTVEEHNASGDEYETLVQIATESYRQSLLQSKTPHDSDHGKWKIIPKDTFNLEFNCLLCRQNFSLQRQLYAHYDNDHEQESMTFPCDSCKRRHISQKALTFHKHSFHNNIEHKDCDLCGQVILPPFFKTHKERHKKAVLYACSICDRTFDRLCTIKQHYRALHEKDKLRRYECSDCDRHFFSEEKLKAHSVVHDENSMTSGMDFLCHICSKRFPKKIDLQIHIKVHKGNIMKCPHCAKQFVRPKDMKYHMRIHTKDFPYKCEVCSRGFAVRWSYDEHIKQHTGHRYKCEQCDKEYVHLSALRIHSYEHRGFPLSCQLCGKGYGFKKKLRSHLKNVHLRSHDGQLSDAALDEYIVRNKIPHLYVKGQYVDDESDPKDEDIQT